MYTYMFVLWPVIGGITLVESGKCTCKPPVDMIPYQNVVCDAEWVIMFQRKGRYRIVAEHYREYKGKIMAVWKPFYKVPEWVKAKLFTFKFNDNVKIYTNATCPVKLENGKAYILSGALRFGELVISRCESLVLPYEAKYKDYERNLKTHFQQNCDCQVRWKQAHCYIDDVDAFFDKYPPGNDSCVGTLQDRHCTNAIGYCSREGNINGTCKWVHVYDKSHKYDRDIPGNTEGQCHRGYCEHSENHGSCHSLGMFWRCQE